MNLRLLVFGMGLAMTSLAQAQNLVLNPGFESGSLSSWSTSSPGNFVTNTIAPPHFPGPHTGTFYLSGGQVGSLANLSQTVASTTGTYRLTYFLASDGDAPNEFKVTVNGVVVTDQLNVPAQGYVQQSFLVPVVGAATLVFGLRNDPGELSLDDISFSLASLGLENIVGLTPNQLAVAQALDAVAGGSALSNAVAGITTGAQLDQFTPLEFGRFSSTTAFNNATFDVEVLDHYLADRRGGANGTFLGGNGALDASGLTINDPSYDSALASVHSRLLAWNPAPSNGAISDVADSVLGGVDMKDSKDMKSSNVAEYSDPWNFYVRGNVILAQGFSQADTPHFDSNTESVELGVDYRISPNVIFGLTAGYGHSDATLDNFGSSATVDSYSPGFYASYADHGWYANLQGNYVHNAYTQARHIDFLGQTANSAPEGNEGVADLDGGYDFHSGALTYGPLAGVQYTHLSVDGYTETGSIADLTVNDQQADSLRSRLGGRVAYAFTGCGLTFRPHFDASWQHEFMDQGRGITSQFQNGGTGSFSVKTDNPSRDSALTDLGLDADINRQVNVFLDYLVQAGQSNYFAQSVQGGVKVGF